MLVVRNEVGEGLRGEQGSRVRLRAKVETKFRSASASA
jgi:hypothetical protein